MMFVFQCCLEELPGICKPCIFGRMKAATFRRNKKTLFYSWPSFILMLSSSKLNLSLCINIYIYIHIIVHIVYIYIYGYMCKIYIYIYIYMYSISIYIHIYTSICFNFNPKLIFMIHDSSMVSIIFSIILSDAERSKSLTTLWIWRFWASE